MPARVKTRAANTASETRAATPRMQAGGGSGRVPASPRGDERSFHAMSTWFRTYGFADVHDDLLIGAYPLDADDVGMLDWLGVRGVVNLVEDTEYRAGEREAVSAA